MNVRQSVRRRADREGIHSAHPRTVTGRKNAAASGCAKSRGSTRPCKSGQRDPGEGAARAGAEFYFEEGELLVPPRFSPTAEEEKVNASSYRDAGGILRQAARFPIFGVERDAEGTILTATEVTAR